MKTIEEIENYIEEQDQNGALLVTGKWGSGKTYLIRQIEKKLNQEPKNLMAVVSLFGIEDTNTLSKKVKEAVAYAQTFNKAEKSGKGHIAKGVNIAKQLSEKAAAFGELFDFGKIKKIAKSANMLLSIDIHDFLPIEKEVYCIVAGEEQPVKKKLVLVFDDFERCKIGVIDLLGIINTYVEDKRIKTIVIASEDNICKQTFGDCKANQTKVLEHKGNVTTRTKDRTKLVSYIECDTNKSPRQHEVTLGIVVIWRLFTDSEKSSPRKARESPS